MKTVLITGCSSGYGLETALHFHAQGWKVIATMRTPKEDVLPRSERLRVLPLDVTQPDSITAAIKAAGPMTTVREIFETNTFGMMAMAQAVLPQFRVRKSGLVINVTSTVTLAPMPLVAAYTASKTAIEGFTESLALELAPFNVGVKLVEPGYGPNTRFTANGAERMQGLVPEAYAPFAQAIFAGLGNLTAVTTAEDVAEAVWRAANDATGQLRYPAGADAIALSHNT
jgi:NAD(P)-dependent dehydrogenase (short-subunit alcohol dehydrogenase family)